MENTIYMRIIILYICNFYYIWYIEKTNYNIIRRRRCVRIIIIQFLIYNHYNFLIATTWVKLYRLLNYREKSGSSFGN